MKDEHGQSERTDKSRSIGEINIERLIGRAYEPETPDGEFAERVVADMLSAARNEAARRARRQRTLKLMGRRLVRWGPVAAAAAILVAFLVSRISREEPRPAVRRPHPVSAVVPPPAPRELLAHPAMVARMLTARGRPAPRADKPIDVGAVIRTQPRQRRRDVLADGSVLYVNQDTEVAVSGRRRLSLRRGEVYVEVSPQGADPADRRASFVIHTPTRDVVALGTHLAVNVAGGKTGVMVTQGKARVSGLAGLLYAGQQLRADDDSPIALPRATYVLDWTEGLMAAAESPLVPKSQHAGGALVAVAPGGQEVNLSLRKFHVDVHMEDGFARTTIDQTYFNHTQNRLEGTFYFPLPPDASLSRLAMYVEGKLNEGGMVERDRARAVYESIVHKMQDPALLEWIDGTTFKMRIFPLFGRREKRIILSYTQKLPVLYGRTTYRFPAGHTMQNVGKWSFRALVKGGAATAWGCDSHKLAGATEGADLTLTASAENVSPDTDVVLDLMAPADEARHAGSAVFSSAVHEAGTYLMLRYRPNLPVAGRRQKRHWVFLFESSGDRDPLLARTQIEVIRRILENAEHDDTFALVTAATRARVFSTGSQGPIPASPPNVVAALDFLDNTHLIGALDLGQALAVAGELCKSADNAHLVHVGAGLPVLGTRDHKPLLSRLPAGTKYVGVGVGKRWSRSFMKAAATATGGYYTQINPDENISWRAFELVSTLNTPRLLNVRVDVAPPWTGGEFLCHSDSVAHGQQVCAVLRVDKSRELPRTVTVTGLLRGEKWSATMAVRNVAQEADYLPRIWARLEIDRLLAVDARKNRERIVNLSKAMYVMSPFTSLLVLENEAMYKQYKVDRGRKDHWALYPCPEKIPVVHEPLEPARPAEKKKTPDTDKAPWQQDVLGTIFVRVVRPFLRPPVYGQARSTARGTVPVTAQAARPAATQGAVKAGGGTAALKLDLPRARFIGTKMKLLTGNLPPGGPKPDKPLNVPFGLGNLAKDKAIAASDDEPIIGELEYVTDGDKEAQDGSFVELGPGKQHVQIDLGAVSEIFAVVVWHDHRTPQVFRDVVAQVSNDEHFIEKETVFNNDHDNSSGLGLGKDYEWIETNQGKIMPTGGVKGRYVRLYSNGGTAGDQNTYTEVEVYGRREGQDPRLGKGTGAVPGPDTRLLEALAVSTRIPRTTIPYYYAYPGVRLNAQGWLAAMKYTTFNIGSVQLSGGELALTTSAGGTTDEAPATFNNAVNVTGGDLFVNRLLDVSALIPGDRRYVTLTLRPQISGGGYTNDDTEFETSMSLPDLTITEVETSILIPDGGTLMLGGRTGSTLNAITHAEARFGQLTWSSGRRGYGTVDSYGSMTNGTLTVQTIDDYMFRFPGAVTNGTLTADNLMLGGGVFSSGVLRSDDGGFFYARPTGRHSLGTIVYHELLRIQQVSTLTARAKALITGRRFRQALEEVERVLVLDPNDRWAAEQKETLEQFIILTGENDVVRSRHIETQQVLIDQKRSEIPWWTELTYPRDWREITSWRSTVGVTGDLPDFVGPDASKWLRGGGVRRSEVAWWRELTYPRDLREIANRWSKSGVTGSLEDKWDRRVRASLKGTIKELSFDDIELKNVIQFLRDVSDANIYVKWSALGAAGIHRTTTVNVHLEEVTLDKALRVILEDVGAAAPLGYVVDSGVISISTRDDLATITCTRVYDVHDLIVAASGAAGRREIISNFIDLFKATIDPDSWQDVDRVGIREMDGQLVITQTRDNHDKIVDLLGQLREGAGLAPRGRAYYQRVAPTMRVARVLYHRPKFTGQKEYFTNLTVYAPGLNTTTADILAALEAEAPEDARPEAGSVDPEARKLIAAARTAGWQALSLAAESDKEGLVMTFDGAGRYAYSRVCAGGLAERVICDGQRLLHLYDQIGLGAVRAVSRFHRAELIDLIPWLVLPADDLAVGANLTLKDQRTVAITPLGAADRKTKDGKGAAYVEIRLVFAKEGRLVERQVVLMPEDRTIGHITYSEDGLVRVLGGDQKVLSERKYNVTPAAAPNLKPDLSKFVILPMPRRTLKHFERTRKLDRNRCETWSEGDALAYIAATTGPGQQRYIWKNEGVIERRFIKKGDRRAGFYVLLAEQSRWPALPKELAARPLGKYLAALRKTVGKGKSEPAGDLGEGFIGRLAAFRDLWYRVRDGKMYEGTFKAAKARRAWRDAVLDYAGRSGPTLFAWALLSEGQGLPGGWKDADKAAAAFDRYAGYPALRYVARYEAARALCTSGKSEFIVRGRERFRKLYSESLADGLLGVFDQSFYHAMRRHGWRKLIRNTAGELVRKNARFAAVVLARQCQQVGDSELGREVLAMALIGASARQQLPLKLAAVAYYRRGNHLADAEQVISELLADERLAKIPSLWRAGADIAFKRGRTASAVQRLDRALDIEYRRLGEKVDVHAVRAAFGHLMGEYANLCQAVATLQDEPPKKVVAGIIRAADRWRALDVDSAPACYSAAKALRRLGANELAWEYLTTPLASMPNEAASWVALAAELAGEGDVDLADRAYAAAFDMEPTNARILWDRAQLLSRHGKAKQAARIYGRISEGSWQPKHESIKNQATQVLEDLKR